MHNSYLHVALKSKLTGKDCSKDCHCVRFSLYQHLHALDMIHLYIYHKLADVLIKQTMVITYMESSLFTITSGALVNITYYIGV